MTASDKEVPNQIFKKLRASKEVSNDSKKNVASHDDPNARTPLGSFGTAAARDKVSEQANCSRQKEQLHKLSCRNAEMTEFVQTQPAIQEASQNTEAIPPHSLSLIVSSDVPVGATPQPLDAVRELVSVRYNQQHKLIGKSLLHSCFIGKNSALSWFKFIEVYHVPSGQSWKWPNSHCETWGGARYSKWIASLELRHKDHNNDP